MTNFKTKKTDGGKVYPRLMIDPDSKNVYMMTAPKCGMKLVQGSFVNSHIPVGTYRTDWDDWDMVDFEGKIKIKGLPNGRRVT